MKTKLTALLFSLAGLLLIATGLFGLLFFGNLLGHSVAYEIAWCSVAFVLLTTGIFIFRRNSGKQREENNN